MPPDNPTVRSASKSKPRIDLNNRQVNSASNLEVSAGSGKPLQKSFRSSKHKGSSNGFAARYPEKNLHKAKKSKAARTLDGKPNIRKR